MTSPLMIRVLRGQLSCIALGVQRSQHIQRAIPVVTSVRNLADQTPKKAYQWTTEDGRKIDASELSTADIKRMMARSVSPTKWEKRILVWSGRYKSESDIPEAITPRELDTAFTKLRVVLNLGMVVFTTAVLFTLIELLKGRREKEHAAIRKEEIAAYNKLLNSDDD